MTGALRAWAPRAIVFVGLVGAVACGDATLKGAVCQPGFKGDTQPTCGEKCGACPVGSECTGNADCESLNCAAGICSEARCDDNRLDGDETAVDCGGACGTCGHGCTDKCPAGQECDSNFDCSSHVCESGVCSGASCTDGVRNGAETDKDCGAAAGCGPCDDGAGCADDRDCKATSRCGDDHLCACVPLTDDAICARDGKQCGSYLADDGCGGSRAVDCGNPCAAFQDCSDNECLCVAARCGTDSACRTYSCTDAQTCTHTDHDGAACEDGLFCTSGDSCLAGVCVGGAASPCDDDEPCTKDVCDEATRSCSHPNDDGALCDDGDACTSGDACAGGACHGTAITCAATDDCHAGACDSSTGCSEVKVADGTPCGSGMACEFDPSIGASGDEVCRPKFWSETLDGDGDSQPQAIHLLSNGDFLVAGETSASGEGHTDAVLWRVHPDGSVASSWRYGGAASTVFWDVAELADGFYVVGGIDAGGVGNGLSMKLGLDGSIVWKQQVASTGADLEPRTILRRDATTYLVAGLGGSGTVVFGVDPTGAQPNNFVQATHDAQTAFSNGVVTNGDVWVSSSSRSADGNFHPFVAKLDPATGQLTDGTAYDIQLPSYVYSSYLVRTSDGGMLLIGKLNGADGRWRIAIIRLDANRAPVSFRILDDGLANGPLLEGAAPDAASNGAYLVVQSNFGGSGDAAVLLQLDATGALVNEQLFASPTSEPAYLYASPLATQDSLLLIGQRYMPGDSDPWLVRTGPDGTPIGVSENLFHATDGNIAARSFDTTVNKGEPGLSFQPASLQRLDPLPVRVLTHYPR